MEQEVVPGPLKKVCSQLRQYFNGSRTDFDIELKPQGTQFQLQVWNQLMKIKYGQVTTYLNLAKDLGDRGLLRAVGGANGSNPIAIIIPCHRVIGANGKLVGYGGGLWRKKWLLTHEDFKHKTDPGQMDIF